MTTTQLKFLVEVMDLPSGVLARCEVPDIRIRASTRSAAVASVRDDLTAYAQSTLAPQIAAIGERGDGWVTCPKAFLQLAADDWYCKATRRLCPINARVSPQHLDLLHAFCNAPPDVREGVIGALRAGYRGAHHLQPGMWLCPTCLTNEEDRYNSTRAGEHYYFGFELHAIGEYLPEILEDPRRLKGRRTLIKAKADLRVLTHRVCADCLVEALRILDGSVGERYEVVKVRVAIS